MTINVETTHGHIAGRAHGAHQSFLGIPYAAPPTGARRFSAPAAADPWSGVRDASAYGPSAPQGPSRLPGMAVGATAEDCLTLNVFTPAADGAARPVMFWIHGGGFTGGSGSQDLYAGGPLVERGDIVLVTINYRLGALGYLAPTSAAKARGAVANTGQLDQIAALEWVRDNIARFGGDPGNVTIFGESAGGMAVATLLAMPAARGLFHRAIPQSGAAHHTHSEASGERVTQALLAELQLQADQVEELWSVPFADLVAAQGRVAARNMFLAFAPSIDSDTLPENPVAAVRAGSASGIDLLIGSNRDEAKLFRMGRPLGDDFDAARLQRAVEKLLPSAASPSEATQLIDTYRKAREGRVSTEPAELLDAIDSDLRFRLPAIRLAEAQAAHAAVYSYLFNWESPARRGALGACHALELPFVFGTLDAPTMDRFAGKGPDAVALSLNMMDAWIAFARGGDPNHAGSPDWPRYDETRRATMIYDRESAAADGPLDEERAAWDGIL